MAASKQNLQYRTNRPQEAVFQLARGMPGKDPTWEVCAHCGKKLPTQEELKNTNYRDSPLYLQVGQVIIAYICKTCGKVLHG